MKRKLQSNRGASILMALLLLLLAIVVSAVILLAATNAARHVDNEFDAQQNYLAVSSAAEMVRDSILSETYTHEDIVTTDAEGNPTASSSDLEVPTGIMAEWLLYGIGDLDSPDHGYTDTITLQVAQGADKVMQPVQAQFSMDKDFNIRIVFSLQQDAAQRNTDTDNCYMTLTLAGNMPKPDVYTTTNDQDQSSTTVTKRTVTWGAAKIRKGDVA